LLHRSWRLRRSYGDTHGLWVNLIMIPHAQTLTQIGPFELTKVARQLSTDIVKKQGGGRIDPVDEAIRRSYHNKTTWQTMGAIYRNRGVFGLYSGFRQHLREFSV
jgi:hypothetical protein